MGIVTELIAVSVLTAVLTVLVGFVASLGMGWVFQKTGYTYEDNRWFVMGSTLAVTGLLVGLIFHGGFELSGINGYYCDNGVACVNKRLAKMTEQFRY